MFRVGITGGIGSGKSLVCRILGILGIPVFEADAEGRRLLRDDPAVRAQVVDAFGQDILVNGEIDRSRLATKVFSDPEDLSTLNAIIHPVVRQRFREWTAMQKAPYVVLEAAILVDGASADQVDHLAVVSAPEQLRVHRVMKRDGSTEDHVKARMRNQVNEETRIAAAATVLYNDEEHMLIPQVLDMHERLLLLARRTIVNS